MRENKLKIDEHTVVHCTTDNLAKQVLKIAHDLGYEWLSGESYFSSPTHWHINLQNTVYYLQEGVYGNLVFVDKNYKVISAEEFIKLHNMEERNIKLTLEKAQEWYKKGGDLKKVALQAFTEKELKGDNFKCITTMDDVIKALDIDTREYYLTIARLGNYSNATVAAFKLNLIRKVLNIGQKMEFTKGIIWYPRNPFVTKKSTYYKDEIDKGEMEVIAKFKVNCEEYLLLGGSATYGSYAGLGSFSSSHSVGGADSHIGFLGCATKEIAQHMGKYFGKEIFEAKYGDTVDFEWV